MSNLPKEVREKIWNKTKELADWQAMEERLTPPEEKQKFYDFLVLLFSSYLIFTFCEAERLFNDAFVIGRKSTIMGHYPTPEALKPKFLSLLELIKKEREK